MEKVLVTGATGFIGLHCVAQLLGEGYAVTGTLRSASRIDEVKQAMTEQQLATDNLSFVEADLLKDDGWDEAVKDCDYVLHVASPFIVGVPKDENELIKPAVEGTERVITAAIKAGVKKMVLTSSCAAINKPHNGKTHFTEDDWTNAEHKKTPAYYKSKTLAERRAWDLVGAQTDDSPMQLAVINPAGVIGPVLSNDIGTSNVFLKQLIAGEVPGCPQMHLGFVDVRDVADLHILAMKNDDANGQRFIASERELWFKDVTAIMRDAGFDKAPSRILPNWVVKMLGLFNPELKQLGSFVGQENFTPSDKARNTLGWKPRNACDSVIETANQLVEKGLVN